MLPRLEARAVGTKWVVTSPDVPELYVVGPDEATARSHVQSALDMLTQMKERRARRDELARMRKHAAA